MPLSECPSRHPNSSCRTNFTQHCTRIMSALQPENPPNKNARRDPSEIQHREGSQALRFKPETRRNNLSCPQSKQRWPVRKSQTLNMGIENNSTTMVSEFSESMLRGWYNFPHSILIMKAPHSIQGRQFFEAVEARGAVGFSGSPWSSIGAPLEVLGFSIGALTGLWSTIL